MPGMRLHLAHRPLGDAMSECRHGMSVTVCAGCISRIAELEAENLRLRQECEAQAKFLREAGSRVQGLLNTLVAGLRRPPYLRVADGPEAEGES